MTKVISDLHLHSIFSDGVLSAEDIARLMKEMNIQFASITDHDTVTITDNEMTTFITGAEFSCLMDSMQIHVLGYFKEIDEIEKEFESKRKRRFTRALDMVECLKQHGVSITREELESETGDSRAPGRPHIARIMLRKGYVRNMNAAFDRYIGDDSPCYVPKEYFTVSRAAELIKANRGIPVLAHPFESGVENMLGKIMSCGLEGIEVFTSKNTPMQREYLRDYCKSNDYLMTGGTDFHGYGQYVKTGLNRELTDKFIERWRQL
ncbi:MAG: hypothetical protein R6U31_03625 [bacterium]